MNSNQKEYKYFDLNGTPCRVENYYTASSMVVEKYERGVGFVGANMYQVLYESKMIEEKEFKDLMMKFMGRKN